MERIYIMAQDVSKGDRIIDSGHYMGVTSPVTFIRRSGTHVEITVGVSTHPTIDTRTKYVFHYQSGVTIQRG